MTKHRAKELPVLLSMLWERLHMATIHDGTSYPEQLQAAACQSFEQFGGECTQQI